MSSKNSTRTIKGMPKSAYRVDGSRLLVNIDYFEFDVENPRDANEYSRETLETLVRSIAAPEHGGVHLPISGYVQHGKLQIIEGHLRVSAVKFAIQDIRNNTSLTPEESKNRIEALAWVPVSLEEGADPLTIAFRMQTSDRLKRVWSFHQQVRHLTRIFRLLKEKHNISSVEDIGDDIASAIGLTLEQLQTYFTVCHSESLTLAMPKFRKCTYKGWRALVEAGRILSEQRQSLMREMTGINSVASPKFKEAIFKLLVEGPLEWYTASVAEGREGRKKAQAGSLLERCLPMLRNTNFPDARIRQWLGGQVDITPNKVERSTSGPQRKEMLSQFLDMSAKNLYDPRKPEPELRSVMSKLKPERSEGSEGGLSEPIKNGVEKVSVSSHTRSASQKSPKGRTFSVSLAGKKGEMSKLIDHLTEIESSPEGVKSFSSNERTLLRKAIQFLAS